MIGREVELGRLRQAADEAPQLVIMRGRRRVGKSFLLDEAFRSRRLIYFQADEGSEDSHLSFLAEECERFTGVPVAFSDWNSVMRLFERLAAEEPLVAVLDEFQWMNSAQELLPSIIMRHYDHWERRRIPVTLVISGSALTMMEQLVEGNKPMFGRAKYRPLIEPFDYRVASEFGSTRLSPEKKLQRYSVLGGTAQYQAWAGNHDLERILKMSVLAKDESLFDEPLQLIRGESTLREPGNYYEIIRVIAQGAGSYSQIASKSKVSSSPVLTDRLRRLEDLRYIELRETIAGNGSATYHIADPFFRFWFRYVYPNRSRLQLGAGVETVYTDIMADLDNFIGPVFEQVCREWVMRYATPEQFPSCQKIGSYWTRTHNVEVDIVGMTKGRFEVLGSCKWSKHADAEDLDKLIASRDLIRGAGTAPLYLFARGFHSSLLRRARNNEVKLISLADLFT